MFSCEMCEIVKNLYSKEHLQTSVFLKSKLPNNVVYTLAM